MTRDELAALRALRPAFNVLMREFDAELTRSHGISHTDYLVLMTLADADRRTMRLTDIAEVCQQSLSAISRSVGRLEQAGLVRKEQDSRDGRNWHAVLTPIGLRRFERAQVSHLDSVREHFLAYLDGVDVGALARALERIARQSAE